MRGSAPPAPRCRPRRCPAAAVTVPTGAAGRKAACGRRTSPGGASARPMARPSTAGSTQPTTRPAWRAPSSRAAIRPAIAWTRPCRASSCRRATCATSPPTSGAWRTTATPAWQATAWASAPCCRPAARWPGWGVPWRPCCVAAWRRSTTPVASMAGAWSCGSSIPAAMRPARRRRCANCSTTTRCSPWSRPWRRRWTGASARCWKVRGCRCSGRCRPMAPGRAAPWCSRCCPACVSNCWPWDALPAATSIRRPARR
ncbi:hypothetical protein D9M69_379490 [compost metagenome]